MNKMLLGIVAISTLIMTPALAADMPVKAPPRQPAPSVQNWTGIYVGANVAYGWGRTQWIDAGFGGLPPGAVDTAFTASGPLAGGQIGFNYQIQNIVIGAEGEWDWSNLRGVSSCFAPLGAGPQSCGTIIRDVATVTGRVGTVWNDALFYVKGGVAWMRANHFNPCPLCGGPAGGIPDDWLASETRQGWTAGLRVEYALSQNWSAKLEYDYIGFRDATLLLVPSPLSPTAVETFRESIQTLKLGVNYRFSLARP